MYKGSLADSLQLTISVNCFILLLIITGIYCVYYYKTRDKTFWAGAIISFNAMLFVLAETIIIISGWTGALMLGRHVYRAEQAVVFLFLSSLPYFMLNVLQFEGKKRAFLNILMLIGLVLTVIVTIVAYAFPDSLVSVTKQSITPLLTPGDFTRGQEGPFFRIRDIMLAVYIAITLAAGIFNLISKKITSQTVFFFAGVLIAVFGGLDDMQYLYTGKNYLLMGLRFSRFVLCMTIMLLFFFAVVFDKFFKAHVQLEQTRQELKHVESKYSFLVEAAHELVFSLSPNLEVISANKKAAEVFNIEAGGNNFIEHLYTKDLDEANRNRYYRDRLLLLEEDEEQLSFNTYIKDRVTGEPVEYHFTFYCFNNGATREIIGRASQEIASKLLDYVDTERITLKVENYIGMVGDIVDRLTVNLKGNLDESEVMMVKMGLNEMIVNAMEHGNLNVSFDEKTQAQNDGSLFDFMTSRRLLPEYRDKKVTVDYFYDDNRVVYRITDMGSGFDYKKIMQRVENEVNQQELAHGRGIIMTQAVFDSVEYNRKGNQVLLVKTF